MGRPLKEIDANEVYKLAKFHCTNKEIAQFFECSTDTIERRFAAELDKGRAEGKITLRKLQWQTAIKGNFSMQIWLGKQYLDQNDKQQIDHKEIMDPGAKEKAKQEFRDWLKQVVSDK